MEPKNNEYRNLYSLKPGFVQQNQEPTNYISLILKPQTTIHYIWNIKKIENNLSTYVHTCIYYSYFEKWLQENCKPPCFFSSKTLYCCK